MIKILFYCRSVTARTMVKSGLPDVQICGCRDRVRARIEDRVGIRVRDRIILRNKVKI